MPSDTLKWHQEKVNTYALRYFDPENNSKNNKKGHYKLDIMKGILE